MEAKDVWRDDAYNYTGQTLDYAVKMNGVVVKKGHASAKDFPITIYLNRLAVDYLEVDWHNNVGFVRAIYSGSTSYPVFQEMPDAAAQFTLVRLEGDTEVETLYDVVYVDTSRGELKTYLSEPINGHACTQQVLPYTVYGGWSGDTPEPPGPEPPGPDSGYTGQYFTLVPRSDGSIIFDFRKWGMGNSPSDIPSYDETDSYYSTDSGATWHKTYLGEVLQLYAGQKVMFKGVNNELFFHTRVSRYPNPFNNPMLVCGFMIYCDYDIEGNVMSLFYGDDFQDKTEFPTMTIDRGYLYHMFDPEADPPAYHGGGQIVNARNLVLPALDMNMSPSLGSAIEGGIYERMFANCTKLETAPELPATTLAQECYRHMFVNCTSLKTAPELPATTLANGCYEGMFDGCTSLTEAPELPATTIALNCYDSMFYGCTSLVEAPELPATTLHYRCYERMFEGCTSLTKAPALPATDFTTYGPTGQYARMFYGCTSLTKAPDLPATTLTVKCYDCMFEGCTNLSSIKCLAEEIPNDATSYWMYNVSSFGVFIKAAGVTWPTGVSGIPSGWRIVNA